MLRLKDTNKFRLLSLEEKESISGYIRTTKLNNKIYARLQVILMVVTFISIVIIVFFRELSNEIEVMLHILGLFSMSLYMYFSIKHDMNVIDSNSIEIISNCNITSIYEEYEKATLTVTTPYNEVTEIHVNNFDYTKYTTRKCNILKLNQGGKVKYLLSMIEDKKIYKIS